ncbi:hypothetical protein [Bradyrhizobium sp. HKCCYLS20291]|uniref:hypothetical protein n=1 Tax=Bradyrhizobium sp. HKCCYLS20291 TaxID=3420766 RepID=UPI003EB6F150
MSDPDSDQPTAQQPERSVLRGCLMDGLVVMTLMVGVVLLLPGLWIVGTLRGADLARLSWADLTSGIAVALFGVTIAGALFLFFAVRLMMQRSHD